MAELTFLRCGRLYDGIRPEMQEDMDILIAGDRISAVGRGLERPEAAREIDLRDLTVTPGMIDAHIHMDFFDWRTVREEAHRNSEEMKTLAIARCARETLRRGFTTVRHVGGITSHGWGVLAVRDAIARGWLEGSRIKAAPHFLSTPGSHGDLSQYYAGNPALSASMQRMAASLGTGSDFFVNAVREQVKYGADFIKIMATGGFFTPNDSPEQQQLNDAELQAIMTTAKQLGTTVTAHVYTPSLMQRLISFGIDGMEHGALMDEETAALIESRRLYLVPTFSPYDEAVHYDEAEIAKKQPEFRRKLELYRERLCAGREVIRKSRMRLGYGTDLVSNHQNHESGWEFVAWMKSGMDPFRALHAATAVNAGILGLDDELGTIEPGKLADLSGWTKNPETEPDALLHCGFVMKEGVRCAAAEQA